MPEPVEIELRSESVQEIVGRIPHWIIRYGITVLLGLILLMIFLSWLIRYPDVINATGVLTSEDRPRSVVARSDGKLVRLDVADGDTLSTNALLAVIESTAEPASMDSLRWLLADGATALRSDTGVFPHLADLQVGEGRLILADLRSASEEFHVWRTETYRTERNAGLLAKIELFKKMISASEKQLTWATRKQQNYATEAKVDTALASSGVIPATEFRKKQNDYIDQQITMSGMERSLQQNRITLLEMQAQLKELQHADEARYRELEDRCKAKLEQLRDFLGTWQLNHNVLAPVAGRVHFAGRLTVNQPVKSGDVLFYLAPIAEHYIVEAFVPGTGAGKVQVGQLVYVRLDGFPANEFGQLIGTVRSMASMANMRAGTIGAEGYRVVVDLPQGLMSSFRRKLTYSPEMNVQVEVVAKERSVLGRIFDRLRGAVQ
jgi:multidrug efflux pump subunit AcrA (membrane-fusion protein)